MNCQRCGNCCIDVGRTFWKNGNLDPDKPFGDLEAMNAWANDGDYEENVLSCEMLRFDHDGKFSCLIQVMFGYKYKPVVCREWQGDERCQKKGVLK